MPERIAELPRSAGGLPVPYVAQWEGEEDMTIEPCEYALGQRSVFPLHGSQVGLTRPVFGVMEPSRQREVVMDVRCQVCRLKLPPIDDAETGGEIHWLIDLLHEPDTMRGHRLSLEPWVCDDCLVYALQVCPGLVMPGARQNLRQMAEPRDALRRVLAVRSANCVATTIKPMGNIKGQPPCVSYLKIEPLRYVRVAAYHLLEYGPAAIRDMLDAEGRP